MHVIVSSYADVLTHTEVFPEVTQRWTLHIGTVNMYFSGYCHCACTFKRFGLTRRFKKAHCFEKHIFFILKSGFGLTSLLLYCITLFLVDANSSTTVLLINSYLALIKFAIWIIVIKFITGSKEHHFLFNEAWFLN